MQSNCVRPLRALSTRHVAAGRRHDTRDTRHQAGQLCRLISLMTVQYTVLCCKYTALHCTITQYCRSSESRSPGRVSELRAVDSDNQHRALLHFHLLYQNVIHTLHFHNDSRR